MARREDMDNIILSQAQRQRQKKVGLNTKLWGQTNKNAIQMIATNEDWKNDINVRVA